MLALHLLFILLQREKAAFCFPEAILFFQSTCSKCFGVFFFLPLAKENISLAVSCLWKVKGLFLLTLYEPTAVRMCSDLVPRRPTSCRKIRMLKSECEILKHFHKRKKFHALISAHGDPPESHGRNPSEQ